MTTPNPLERLLHDLVIANRILAHEGVLDAYGHVSVRNPLRPDHFFLSRSRSPELVTREDIMEFDYAGNPTPGDTRPPYLERFIHGGIYEARPDIHAVVHSHADEVLPFTIANRVLQPVIHTASDMGSRVSVWDIRDKFGDTNMLVVNPEQGRDLAQCLGPDRVVLMRGHGFAAGAPSLFQVVKTAVYLPLNARTLKEGLQLGEVKTLSPGEVAVRATTDQDAPASRRAWEYWCRRINMTPYWEL